MYDLYYPDTPLSEQPNPNTLNDTDLTHQLLSEKFQILKNNGAQIYWPAYGFNGIGDLLPGQGYDLRQYDDSPTLSLKWGPTTYPTGSNGDVSYNIFDYE